MLSKNGYAYAVCTVCVTIFSTGNQLFNVLETRYQCTDVFSIQHMKCSTIFYHGSNLAV